MDKQNVVCVTHTHTGILFSLKKKKSLTTATTHSGHYAKQHKPITKGQILYDFTYMRDLE